MSARPVALRGGSARPASRTTRSTPRPARQPIVEGDDGGTESRHVVVRTVGLVLVLLVAFIVLAPTLRAYVVQQEQLRDLNAQLASSQAQVAALEDELERWTDPAYVKAQARDRFSYVLPGETMFRVIDPETVTGEDPMADLTTAADSRSPYAASVSDPWYVSVWQSVQIAGTAADALAQEGEAAAG